MRRPGARQWWHGHPTARASHVACMADTPGGTVVVERRAGTRVQHRWSARLTAPAMSSGRRGLKLRFEWRAPRVARAPHRTDQSLTSWTMGALALQQRTTRAAPSVIQSGSGGHCERTGSTRSDTERIVVLQRLTTRSGSCQALAKMWHRRQIRRFKISAMGFIGRCAHRIASGLVL